MRRHRLVLLTLLVAAGPVANGCSSGKQELPSQEKIQQQLKRDAEMRMAEDRLEKEKGVGKH